LSYDSCVPCDGPTIESIIQGETLTKRGKNLYLRISLDTYPGKMMTKKSEYECPACGAKLEFTNERTLIIKPNSPSKLEIVPGEETDDNPRLIRVIHREQAEIIQEILSEAEPFGLLIEDLTKLAEERGVQGDDFEHTLSHLHDHGEVYRTDIGKWKVLNP
jgi:hypothetical protein